jgi:hypothetical protein
MEPIEVRKHIKKMMTAYRTESLCYQVLDEAQKIIKNNINSEQASQEASRFIVDAFPAVIFSTFKDEDDTWYTIRAEYIEQTETGYVYKLIRRPTMTGFASDADAQFIMVKLSHRPDENDLKDIWDKVVKERRK